MLCQEKWSELKILIIGTKYDLKRQIAWARVYLHAVHVEACMPVCVCLCALAFQSLCFALDELQLCRFEVISLGHPAESYIKTHTDTEQTHTEWSWTGLKHTARKLNGSRSCACVCLSVCVSLWRSYCCMEACSNLDRQLQSSTVNITCRQLKNWIERKSMNKSLKLHQWPIEASMFITLKMHDLRLPLQHRPEDYLY